MLIENSSQMGVVKMMKEAMRDKDGNTGFRGVKEKSGGRPKG